MARKLRRKLNLSEPLYVRRRITTKGREFGPRDILPWKELGIQPRTMESWYRLRMISHDPAGDIRTPNRLTDSEGRRLDGPTIEEWVKAGYLPENYPPPGWAPRYSPAYEQFSKTGEMPELTDSEPDPSQPSEPVAGDSTAESSSEGSSEGVGEASDEEESAEDAEVATEEESVEASETVAEAPAPVAEPPAKASRGGRRRG